MPAVPRYAYYTPRCYALVQGVKFDVASFSADYELNGIPRCQLLLPVGRSTKDNSLARIHQLATSLGDQTGLQVFAQFTPTARSDENITDFMVGGDGYIKVFDGYTSGGGYSRGTSGARYVLAGNDGLVKLNQASALSDSSHPSNPARYSYGALPNAGDTGAVATGSSDSGAGRDWTVMTSAKSLITPGTVAADLWGSALYPWLKKLTTQNGMWIGEPSLRGDATNAQAASGLARLVPGGNGYVPLALRGNFSIDADIGDMIAQDVASQTYDVGFTANQTLWDILVGHFAADYCFAVVPRIGSALVVPYVGGYRGADTKPYKEISAGEYDASDHSMAMLRPLRAYGIRSSMLTRTGSSGFDDDAPSSVKLGMGGWFDAGADVNGAVLIQQGPRWMSNVTSPGRHSPSSTGASGAPTGSAFHPGAGTPNTSRTDARMRTEQLVKPLLDAFAQVRYAQETVRGRSLVISGPFRLDIAPGSLVRVAGSPEQFIASDRLAVSLVGDVQRVSLVIDAESGACGTAFHIGNVRDDAENATDRASVATHPLFAKTFSGCPLRADG